MSAATNDPAAAAPDVLVVGAGPVGLMMASELRRHGVTCRIIDRSPEATDKSKAVVVHARTLEHLDHLKLEQQFLQRGTIVHGVSFFADGIRFAQLHFDGVDSRYPFVLSIPQSSTERLLGDHLASLGVQIERRVEFLDFTQDESGVLSRLQHPNGRIETLRTKFLSGCDGSHSTVRQTAGINFIGHGYEEEWILADVKMEAPPFARDEVVIFSEPNHFTAVFPLPEDRWRLIAVRKIAVPGEPPAPATVKEFTDLLLHHTKKQIAIYDPVWISPFRIGHKYAEHISQGRIFLSGDAAHIHSQVSGQGMNTGLQDAVNLGWKLGLVCRGKAKAELLATYEAERLPMIRKILFGTDWATKAVTLRHTIGQKAVNYCAKILIEFEPVHHYLNRNITELEINYRGRGYVSPFYVENSGRSRHRLRRVTAPGDHAPRAPHLTALPSRESVRLYDVLRNNGHTLIFLQGERTPRPGAAEVVGFADEVRGKFGDRIYPLAIRLEDTWIPSDFPFPLLEDIGEEMHHAYDAESPMVYLIRPDGYIGFRSDWEDREQLVSFLQSYLV
jgi:2-polyprenyl-6-methoxyphenol hydroxylase-like FAD-dependent oxidoreductase